MKTMKYMVLAAAATMVLGSCVSKKELVAAQQQLQECQDKGKSLGQKYYEAHIPNSSLKIYLHTIFNATALETVGT